MTIKVINDIRNFAILLSKSIDELLPNIAEDNDLIELYSSMRYMMFAPAKYLRPFLVFVVAKIFNVSTDRIMPVCVAVECMHVFSLIHDDLPALDDDDMRRNQPSCHKKFSEATAILTGDALLVLAFEILATLNEKSDLRCELIRVLTQAIGHKGMIGGQILDISNQDPNKISKVQLLKTAALFAAACELGAILGEGSQKQRSSLIEYGKNLGHAFQIIDDLKDATKNSEKNNIANIEGIDIATSKINNLCEQAINSITIFTNSGLLYDLIKYVQTNI